eukprot:CAMPEP_0172624332 /NCGR_PEP_ID=MMETSP1068-20121228/135618_1 /TAXON_ID=35684 /ORGANISM="Pseudopedinella elastica, Strain CCMP716" /LENGTH=111 /DNA_ID=CAMNT_0013433233 /DNA_START=168 /DNA_END=503 /DNA_ORIENTATION=+
MMAKFTLPAGLDLERMVKLGNRGAFFFAYTAAISSSSISSDVPSNGNLAAACTFTWFTTVALGLAVLEKDTHILDRFKGSTANSDSYVPHTGESARGGDDATYATPASADL